MIKLEIQSEDLAGREEHRSRVELITPETRSSWLASPDSITKLPGIGGAVDALGLADGPQSRSFRSNFDDLNDRFREKRTFARTSSGCANTGRFSNSLTA